MSALEAFINEQRKKSVNITSGIGSSSFSSFGDFRSKLSTSISGLPLLSRSDATDSQSLTREISEDGQLPQGKNRKNGIGWFSSGDENFFGMSRTQRIFAFFLCLVGAAFCFSTAAFLIPIIILYTRKFAALNTLGSVLLLLR
uniref:Vesicle transport protein n=1 Tax=Heterorhabditis bacteriophora TaxID=37862 RepID=A0A1I7WBU0_HETBA